MNIISIFVNIINGWFKWKRIIQIQRKWIVMLQIRQIVIISLITIIIAMLHQILLWIIIVDNPHKKRLISLFYYKIK